MEAAGNIVGHEQVLLLQSVSDAAIALAYLSTPITFWLYARKRDDGAFNGTLAICGLFLVATGLMHALSTWTNWHPTLWLDGALKAATATASLATAALLVPLIPKAVALRSASAREPAVELRSDEPWSSHVAEHAPVGLGLLSLDGRFLQANSALCALLGFGAAEFVTLTSQAITHPADLDADLEAMQRMLDDGTSACELEKRYFRKDGTAVWTLLSLALVRETDGEPSYFIAQIQNITLRKDAEAALLAANRAAIAAADTKSRLLATMSHEIRTPMNGIIGMTELLSSSQLDSEQREFVKVVRDSGQSLLRVLNDILDYSQIDAGRLKIENVDFDLPRQLRSVVSLLESPFASKGVSLTTQLEANVPFTLAGDPYRLRQLLFNILTNALKFTPAGGSVRVFVTAEPTIGAAIPIRFTIVDTGIGIESEAARVLFQPFPEHDGTATRRYGGTGLGLSICKRLVDRMGGRIGVVSTVGFGSSFWFVLPFQQGKWIERVLDAPAREMDLPYATMKPRTEKLLLAEDNDVNILLALKQFERLGFTLTIVSNGREAVEAVQSDRYDVIFMDCHMPEMDGYEATQAIRRITSQTGTRVPIVAMTADVQPEDRDACRVAGMDDYIAKPVALSDLYAVLERWLPDATQEVHERSAW